MSYIPLNLVNEHYLFFLLQQICSIPCLSCCDILVILSRLDLVKYCICVFQLLGSTLCLFFAKQVLVQVISDFRQLLWMPELCKNILLFSLTVSMLFLLPHYAHYFFILSLYSLDCLEHWCTCYSIDTHFYSTFYVRFHNFLLKYLRNSSTCMVRVMYFKLCNLNLYFPKFSNVFRLSWFGF